jgi:hypothetical protein
MGDYEETQKLKAENQKQQNEKLINVLKECAEKIEVLSCNDKEKCLDMLNTCFVLGYVLQIDKRNKRTVFFYFYEGNQIFIVL